MNLLKHTVKNHTLICLYALVLVVLMYGVYNTSGTTHIGLVLLHGITIVLCYTGLHLIGKKLELFEKLRLKKAPLFNFDLNSFNLPRWLTVLSIIQIIVHLVMLHGSPAINAFSATTIDEAAEIRRNITANAPILLSYISSINIKGVAPFLLLYLLFKKDYKLYYLFLIIASFYAFSLMQKSYIVTILLPALVYSIVDKKWLYAFKYVSIIGIVVVGLIVITNPIKPAPVVIENEQVEPKSGSRVINILYGLQKRMLVTPGEIVSEWFDHIPKDKPFLNGDGYRLLAKMRGNEYRNYSVELYPIIRPQYAERGLQGSVNVATFVYDYSNFGKKGLVLGGFILALLFIVIESIFKADFKFKLCFNFFPILILSSAAYTTLLFSGGWFFLIALYYLFLRNKN